jgi:hypothetical protein
MFFETKSSRNRGEKELRTMQMNLIGTQVERMWNTSSSTHNRVREKNSKVNKRQSNAPKHHPPMPSKLTYLFMIFSISTQSSSSYNK